MLVVLVGPPLLAATYFTVTDLRLRPLVAAILSGFAFVLAAFACGAIYALASIFIRKP
jgi:hypothetical protein